MRKLAQVLLIMAALLAWITPIAAVPFVTELPYLFESSFESRLLICSCITFLICVLWWCASTSNTRANALALASTREHKLTLLAGAGFFTLLSALLAGNSLGLIVIAFKTEPIVQTMVVVDVRVRSKKFEKAELELKCPRSKKRFQLVLSKKLFDYSQIHPNQILTLYGRSNVYGTYIDATHPEKSDRVTC